MDSEIVALFKIPSTLPRSTFGSINSQSAYVATALIYASENRSFCVFKSIRRAHPSAGACSS